MGVEGECLWPGAGVGKGGGGGLRREHDMYFVMYKNENFDVGNGPWLIFMTFEVDYGVGWRG